MFAVAALTLTEAYVDQDSAKDARLLEDIIPLLKTGGELEKLPIDQQAFLKLIQTFTVQEEGVVKVTKSRIYSLDWHPNASKLLLAAGDRDGNIGIVIPFVVFFCLFVEIWFLLSYLIVELVSLL